MRLAAGLRPDPLGDLKCSPRLPSRNSRGCLLLRGRKEKGMGKEKEGMVRGGKGRGEKKGEGRTPVPD